MENDNAKLKMNLKNVTEDSIVHDASGLWNPECRTL
jgi:hypothetical protein